MNFLGSYLLPFSLCRLCREMLHFIGSFTILLTFSTRSTSAYNIHQLKNYCIKILCLT